MDLTKNSICKFNKKLIVFFIYYLLNLNNIRDCRREHKCYRSRLKNKASAMTTELVETPEGFYSKNPFSWESSYEEDYIPHGTRITFASGKIKESFVVYNDNGAIYEWVPTVDLSHIGPLLANTANAKKRKNICRYDTFITQILAKIRWRIADQIVGKDRLHELDLFSVFNEADVVKYLRFIDEKPKDIRFWRGHGLITPLEQIRQSLPDDFKITVRYRQNGENPHLILHRSGFDPRMGRTEEY